MRKNTSNVHDRSPEDTQSDMPLPVQKARVLNANPHPDEDGFHTVTIRIYGDNAPHRAPVLMPMPGCVWVPKEGQDVAVLHGNGDKPWVIGSWYALDRVEDGEVDIPDYTPGDIRIGNESGAHVVVEDGGDVRLNSSSDGSVYIDGVQQ